MSKSPSHMSNKQGKKFIQQVAGARSTKKQLSQSGKVPQRWVRTPRRNLQTNHPRITVPHSDEERVGKAVEGTFLRPAENENIGDLIRCKFI